MVKLFAFILCLTPTHAVFAQEPEPEPDPRILQSDDVEKLTAVAADLVSKCKDMSGKKTVTIKSFTNKADEKVSKKMIVESMQTSLKEVARISTAKSGKNLPALNLELTAEKNLTGNLQKSTYWLKVKVKIDDDADACAIESKFEKTGQL
ncbi:MAG: hypothetical protein ABL958_13470 [Bdellovibrionia bacterium]